jgi:hypothetical protein
MSNFWWLQPDWTETQCAQCGAKIWPEGDPDHGLCWQCWNENWHAQGDERGEREGGERG